MKNQENQKLVDAPPYQNIEGDVCGLCDGDHAHEHLRLKCVICQVSGLAENMPAHKCLPFLHDDYVLVGAKTKLDHSIPVYDDGWGLIFIHRHSIGISGIVRAQTWEDAYGICEDEFFPEADETVEELCKTYGFRVTHEREFDATTGAFTGWKRIETPDEDAWSDHPEFQETYGFRPNGPRAGKWESGEPRDPIGHGIYARDLNGDALDPLTPEFLAQLGIVLEIKHRDDV